MLHSRQRFESWLPALFDGEFHWDFLKPAFKDTKIMPMDFDAVVERRGHVLIFETKIAGKGIDIGQAITLTTAWKKGATIIQLEGKSPEDITSYALYSEIEENKNIKVGDKQLNPCDAFDIIYIVRRWFCWASGSDKPSREEWDRQIWLWDYERNSNDKNI